MKESQDVTAAARGKVIRVCFHGIGSLEREREPGEARFWIPVGTFQRMLDLVADRTDVIVSFDDGNASDYEVAFPELKARNLSAEFFPLAARLDKPGSLSRAAIREMASSGMTIGTHGMHHRSWRRLIASERVEEFDDARREIANAAGQAVTLASCPLGEYDRNVVRELRRKGYAGLMTSDGLPSRRNQWLRPRFSIRGSDSLEDFQRIIEGRPSFADTLVRTGSIAAKRLRSGPSSARSTVGDSHGSES